jgi:hypothetical protein
MLIADRFSVYLQKISLASQASRTLEQQSPSYDPIHRRELKLSPAQLALFKTLKPKAHTLFTSLNKTSPNTMFLDNLVCRMMGNENYKEE